MPEQKIIEWVKEFNDLYEATFHQALELLDAVVESNLEVRPSTSLMSKIAVDFARLQFNETNRFIDALLTTGLGEALESSYRETYLERGKDTLYNTAKFIDDYFPSQSTLSAKLREAADTYAVVAPDVVYQSRENRDARHMRVIGRESRTVQSIPSHFALVNNNMRTDNIKFFCDRFHEHFIDPTSSQAYARAAGYRAAPGFNFEHGIAPFISARLETDPELKARFDTLCTGISKVATSRDNEIIPTQAERILLRSPLEIASTLATVKNHVSQGSFSTVKIADDMLEHGRKHLPISGLNRGGRGA